MMEDEYKRLAARILISPCDDQRPRDWDREFQRRLPIQVEIGFGQGEYLLSSLENDPQVSYVGIELDWGRIVKCFKKAARLPEPQQRLVQDRVRIMRQDAWAAFERFFRPRTITRAVCLFPCPWPKERHERHRLFSRDFLRLLNSRLEDAGSLRCVTDDRHYADWVLEQSLGTGFEVFQKSVPPVFGTKFERKWRSRGQEEFYELFFQKREHADIPLREDSVLKAFYHNEFYPEHFEFTKNVADGIAVVPGEWAFDPLQEKGLIRLIVSEEHLTQHLWVVIIKTRKGWCVLRAEGQNILPTPGIARAIELVSRAVERTSGLQSGARGAASFQSP